MAAPHAALARLIVHFRDAACVQPSQEKALRGAPALKSWQVPGLAPYLVKA